MEWMINERTAEYIRLFWKHHSQEWVLLFGFVGDKTHFLSVSGPELRKRDETTKEKASASEEIHRENSQT